MLDKLPVEVRDLIFQYLTQEDLLNLLCSANAFSEVAIPALWSTVWVDTLPISGYRDANTITQKALADCRLNLPVEFVHEKRRRYMFVGRSRLREFCYGLQRGKYTYALSCVKTLNVSLEYTLQPCHVMGELEECDELGLVHWLIEQIPKYFSGLTQLEILTESVTEETGPAVAKLDFNNVPTNLFLTIEHSHLARLGKIKFDNIKVLRLEITFQERLSYDLAKHFRAQLPDTVERLDLVNYAESSITANGFTKFIKNCRRLRSLTVFSPVLVGSHDSALQLPQLEVLHIALSNASILKVLDLPYLDRLSVETFAHVDPLSDALVTLLASFKRLPYLRQLYMENVSLPCVSQIMSHTEPELQTLVVQGSLMELTDSYQNDLKRLAGYCKGLSTLVLDVDHTPQESTEELWKLFASGTLTKLIMGEPEALHNTDKAIAFAGEYVEDGWGIIRLKPTINRYLYEMDLESLRKKEGIMHQ